MLTDELQRLIRKGTRNSLWEQATNVSRIDIGWDAIQRMVPHREPFLFVDQISEIDWEKQILRGKRKIRTNDPVFAGHFPEYPVYPGALQLETIGQFGLCLLSLSRHGAVPKELDKEAAAVRAVKIHYAAFLAEVGPGADLDIVVLNVRADALTAIYAGQILRAETICAFGVMEVYFAAT